MRRPLFPPPHLLSSFHAILSPPAARHQDLLHAPFLRRIRSGMFTIPATSSFSIFEHISLPPAQMLLDDMLSDSHVYTRTFCEITGGASCEHFVVLNPLLVDGQAFKIQGVQGSSRLGRRFPLYLLPITLCLHPTTDQ
ncbi:hypothetical protein PM082_021609 [Marasmius tenuissimus]|nr:hypothetical protein PM082_021609 [Marasmius tenuissimus]